MRVGGSSPQSPSNPPTPLDLDHQLVLQLVTAATEISFKLARPQRNTLPTVSLAVSVARASLTTSWGFGFVSGEGPNPDDKARCAASRWAVFGAQQAFQPG